MFGTRAKAAVLVAAAVAGYAGAATFSALALPSVAVADDYGPGDGLTRYAVTASAEAAAALGGLPGVVSTQRLTDGRSLVATEGLTPADLQGLPGVVAVEVSPSVPVMGTVSDPYWPNYGWNLDNTGSNAYQQTAKADADTDAPDGWPTSTGDPVIVAVVDTGYDSDHPDLRGALWTNPAESCGGADTDGNGKAGDCHGWNFTTNSPDVDNGSHGTHGTSVAGVLAARAGNGEGSAGVAPDVQIMPLVIGGGESVDVLLGAEAIRYAADHGASVVNASWGGSFSGSALDALKSAIAYAASKGVLVVAAAGNDSLNRDTSILYPASLTDPNLITVGAATAADTVSSFSAYGANSVDLFAPGTLVFSTWNDGGYRLIDGTSIAAPQVAAALALYHAVDPSATATDLRARLLADVDPVPAFVGKSVTGGRLSLSHLGDSAAEQVRYTFTSMTSAAGVVAPHVTATGPDAAGSYSVELGLGMEYAGEVFALADIGVALGGTTALTDDEGTARFDLGARPSLGTLELAPSMELGDGRYVLTAQLFLEGEPLGRAYAAPLLVGAAAGGDAGTPGGSGSAGSGSSGSGSAGSGSSGSGSSGSSGSGSSGSSGSDPGSSSPGSDGSGSTPDAGDSPSGDGAGSVPEVPSGDDADMPEVTTPGGSSSGSGGSGGSSTDGTGSGASGSSGSGSGGSSGSSGSGDGGSTAPGDVPAEGGTIDFPAVGDFRITSLSPARVGTAGGTLVTVTGEALPDRPRVRIGSTAAATVVRWSATEVAFLVPARVAGTYDVAVFAPDGRSTVLSGALEYVEGLGAGGSGGAGSDGPATSGGTPGAGTGGSTDPGAGGSGGSGDGGSAGAGDGSDDAAVAPVERRGPHGERLVRSTRFAGLSAIWSMDCSVSCTGVAI
ncbi:S8 family serine peptidase [Geodermatophilus sp. URMC 64]